jgi:hypothetical protein
MNIDKVEKGIILASKMVIGLAAGYFVYKATEDKADELTEDCGFVKRNIIQFGRVFVSTAVGIVTGQIIA